jgi:hypothetical protein
MTSRVLPLAGVIALASCTGDPRDPRPAIDAAAINALVPAALKDKLVFERRDLVIQRGPRKTTYTVAAPHSWIQHGDMSAHLRPDDLPGVAAHFEIGSNCDGPCTPKPWEAVATKVHFTPRAGRKVIQDVKAPGRRTMIVELERAGVPTTEVIVAWWTEGARNYHTCKASLGAALQAAAPAFAAACQAVAVAGDY